MNIVNILLFINYFRVIRIINYTGTLATIVQLIPLTNLYLCNLYNMYTDGAKLCHRIFSKLNNNRFEEEEICNMNENTYATIDRQFSISENLSRRIFTFSFPF